MAKKNYINGIFVRKNETQYGEIFNLGITDEAIEAIKNLPKNDKGVRNLSMAAQKEDANKYSVWENDYKPKATASVEEDGSNTLPF